MKNNSSSLYRLAILTAIIALIAVVLGATFTGLTRTIVPTPAAPIPAALATIYLWHHISGGVAVVLILALAIWRRKKLAWIALSAGTIDGLLGITQQPSASILHALLGQIFFGCIAALAVVNSPGCRHEPINDTWKPSLRSLSIAVPAVILLQTTLGASYRYRAIGVLWHILDAGVVLLLVLIVSIFLIRQFPNHPTLKPAATAFAVITSIQVLLGFTTFMMLILFPETSLAVVITEVLHVTTGALTFAAGLTLALLIRFNIRGAQVTPGH